MNPSFFATIGFALLAMFCTFLANMACLIFTNSNWHSSGVILAILAMASSYWAQGQYTMAGLMRDDNKGDQVMHLAETIQRAESCGQWFQILAIAMLAGALACFWLGLR